MPETDSLASANASVKNPEQLKITVSEGLAPALEDTQEMLPVPMRVYKQNAGRNRILSIMERFMPVEQSSLQYGYIESRHCFFSAITIRHCRHN
jgi:hypothetical protein